MKKALLIGCPLAFLVAGGCVVIALVFGLVSDGGRDAGAGRYPYSPFPRAAF